RLCDAAARVDVTGRPMKSRSFDGSQFQYRNAVVEVTRPGPTVQSTLTDPPPKSWLDCQLVSVSVSRSNALRLGGVYPRSEAIAAYSRSDRKSTPLNSRHTVNS